MRFFSFALTFVVLFCLTYAFLAAVDSLPEPRDEGVAHKPTDTPVVVQPTAPELPVRVVAQDIGLDWKVLNPQSTDTDALNAAVDEAPMRWPTSGRLGENGTIALFGHSSHLPIVHNQAYKAFNGIEDLEEGQTISVYSGTTEYRYKVREVRHAKAVASTDSDVLQLPTDGKYLILVTCDNFGSKSDRYIVTADYAGAYAI
jgi:LPXTG-site transpeptidase (sortase) family protein